MLAWETAYDVDNMQMPEYAGAILDIVNHLYKKGFDNIYKVNCVVRAANDDFESEA